MTGYGAPRTLKVTLPAASSSSPQPVGVQNTGLRPPAVTVSTHTGAESAEANAHSPGPCPVSAEQPVLEGADWPKAFAGRPRTSASRAASSKRADRGEAAGAADVAKGTCEDIGRKCLRGKQKAQATTLSLSLLI